MLTTNYNSQCNYHADFEVYTSSPKVGIVQTGTVKCNRTEVELYVGFIRATGPVYYDWFIQGDTFEGRNIIYDYKTPNTNVPAKLTITDGNGCNTDFYDTIWFDQDFLSANFEADTSGSFCPPLSVNFLDLSVSPGAPIKSWLWEFGDGTSSIH